MKRKRNRYDAVVGQTSLKRLTIQVKTTQPFDFTAIADQIKAVKWSDNSYEIGMVKGQTFPLATPIVQSTLQLFLLILHPEHKYRKRLKEERT